MDVLANQSSEKLITFTDNEGKVVFQHIGRLGDCKMQKDGSIKFHYKEYETQKDGSIKSYDMLYHSKPTEIVKIVPLILNKVPFGSIYAPSEGSHWVEKAARDQELSRQMPGYIKGAESRLSPTPSRSVRFDPYSTIEK